MNIIIYWFDLVSDSAIQLILSILLLNPVIIGSDYIYCWLIIIRSMKRLKMEGIMNNVN